MAPDAIATGRTTIYISVKSFQTNGIIVDTKRTCRRHVLPEEKLDDIGARWTRSVSAYAAVFSDSSARNAVKQIHVRVYNTAEVRKYCC